MWRSAKILSVVSIALSLCACVSGEGSYSPDCIAFAGDTIDLDDGRFVWDKFTDQVEVGDDGRAVDAYPDYPKRGSYRIDGDRVMLTSDAGEALPVFYLVRSGDRTYLYTQDQYSAWVNDNESVRCPLVLGGSRQQD